MEHLKDYDMKTLHEWEDGEVRTTELHFYQAFLINKLDLLPQQVLLQVILFLGDPF